MVASFSRQMFNDLDNILNFFQPGERAWPPANLSPALRGVHYHYHDDYRHHNSTIENRITSYDANNRLKNHQAQQCNKDLFLIIHARSRTIEGLSCCTRNSKWFKLFRIADAHGQRTLTQPPIHKPHHATYNMEATLPRRFISGLFFFVFERLPWERAGPCPCELRHNICLHQVPFLHSHKIVNPLTADAGPPMTMPGPFDWVLGTLHQNLHGRLESHPLHSRLAQQQSHSDCQQHQGTSKGVCFFPDIISRKFSISVYWFYKVDWLIS